MGVRVDEPGHQRPAADVDDDRIRGVDRVLGHRRNAIVLHENIDGGLPLVAALENDLRILEENVGHASLRTFGVETSPKREPEAISGLDGRPIIRLELRPSLSHDLRNS